jgi:hypothetical protein
MGVIEKIAFYQNRRDDVPNQKLASALASNDDRTGIKEIAENLTNTNSNIRSDCLKVLYEIGYLQPDLITDYIPEFLVLLSSKENRMVWGAMIAIACIANLKSDEIFMQIDLVILTTRKGTIITQVWGIRTLSRVAAANPSYKSRIMPFLLEELRICLPRDIPTHLESMLPLITASEKIEIMEITDSRFPEMTPAQQTRLKKVLKQISILND